MYKPLMLILAPFVFAGCVSESTTSSSQNVSSLESSSVPRSTGEVSSSSLAMSSSSLAMSLSSLAMSSSSAAVMISGIPGSVNADSFSEFEDTTLENLGNCGNGPVDQNMASSDQFGVCNIGYVAAGESLEYEIDAMRAGAYIIEAVLAANSDNRTMRLSIDGEQVTEFVAPANGFNQYESIASTAIDITSGSHTLRVSFAQGGINLAGFVFDRIGPIGTTPSSSSVASSAAASQSSAASSEGEASCSLEQVQEVFADSGCIACHSNEQAGLYGGDLSLVADDLGRDLLGQATTKGGLGCADQMLIDPLDASNSLLLKLIDPTKHDGLTAEGCNRGFMPPFGDAIPSAGVQCVESWIEGVIESEVPPDSTPANKPFQPTNTSAALSRAKYILHGGAVTEQELTEMGGSSATLQRGDLRSLITQWQQTPEYAIKIKSFLTLALQQTTKKDTLLTEQFNNIRGEAIGKARLQRNFEEMFTRTAWEIVKNNEDFRQVVTTNEWMVTTGMLAALAYTDKPQQTSGRDYLDRSAQNDQFKNFSHLDDSDFNDWRKVTLAQSTTPQNYANTAAFAERMREVEAGSTFNLRMPRIGFFSTPAFYDNWATNDDNQFRATIQQTMIVALDKPISPDDATPHLTNKGIPEDHADPESACFQCHRHMDPMRQVFNKYQNTRNRSTAVDDSLEPSFSFFGVSQNFSTVDEFAQILATHPEFPNAWVQKLCMWANSQRCNPADPEFQRLSGNFTNNFSFNALVRQFFSSPLFTGVEVVKSHETNEYLVSMSRGSHYCNAMNARIKTLKEINGTTGSVNLCNDRDELGIVAPDVFARGQTDFVQSTQVSGFESKAIDVQCAKASNSVFALNDNRIINTTKGAPKAIKQMVEVIMGVPQNHERHDALVDQLTRIYEISSHDNECAGNPGNQGDDITCGYDKNLGDSLKITWFTACTSPEIISVGL